MAEYKGVTLTDQIVDLDGAIIEHCTLVRCTLRYSGGKRPLMSHTSFVDCQHSMSGPAAETLKFMAQMYQIPGGEEHLEPTFDSIRLGHIPTEEEASTKVYPKFPDTPLEFILRDIETALNRRMPYLAIAVALSIPDICSAMERTPPDTKRPQYLAWCEKYLIPKYGRFTADDCYRMRCGIMHQGHFGRPDSKYDRLFMTVRFAPSGGVSFNENVSINTGGLKETVLQLDSRKFCENMLAGARAWYSDKVADPHVAANMPNLVRLHPDGLAPYFTGVPCIG